MLPDFISGIDIKILFSKVDSPLKTSHFWRVKTKTRQKWLVFKGEIRGEDSLQALLRGIRQLWRGGTT
jgi:hypothetical protein